MKKTLLVFILFFIIIIHTNCTIAPNAPTEGIWHCEELKLVIEFDETNASVYSYDENLSQMDLKVRCWIDGGFDIIYQEDEEEAIEIYAGWRKATTKDKFVIYLFGKADPEDNYKTRIELDDEEYTFVRINSHDEINRQ